MSGKYSLQADPWAFISLGLLVSASLGTCPRIRN